MIRSSRSALSLDHRYRKLIRNLIWVYFFLLIFEGFLRMVLPPLSSALLVVREPFLLAMYVVAMLSSIFPWNRFMVLFLGLGMTAMALGFFVLPSSPTVLMYGFRCSFLHVPLIFLIPRVMDEADVVAIGHWFLLLALPIALLMSVQFAVGPNHWLNRGLDNQFTQIGADVGRIRPPGTFTAVTGPIHFFTFVVAFLVYAHFNPRAYTQRLIMVASIATCLGVAVSISRSALFNIAVVILTSAVGVAMARPRNAVRFVRFAAVGAFGFFVASQLPIFDESTAIFTRRIEGAGVSEGGAYGIMMRFVNSFLPFEMMSQVPIEGVGLGRGTNAGNILFSGRLMAVAENEWSRIVFELGPLMGVAYILMRIQIAFTVLRDSFRTARFGRLLPVLLVGACWLEVLNGTWQQTTSLGFASLGAGLVLAGCNPSSRLAETA